MKRQINRRFVYAGLSGLLVLVAALALFFGLRSSSGPRSILLSSFEADLTAGRVDSAVIHEGEHRLTGRLADGQSFQVAYPASLEQELTDRMLAAKVEVSAAPGPSRGWSVLYTTYGPVLLLAGALVAAVYLLQNSGGRVSAFGRARPRSRHHEEVKVTFADVAGADEAVTELQEIRDFLVSPARFQSVGAKVPKGVLLFGPPGTGKTLLARAVAGEAGVPFFSISGSDFVEMFVGVGASRVRDLFEQAKAAAPSIVFMDEIDAVGRHRGAGLGGGHDEREQTLNQLLVELDGFDVRGGVILIAATNRPDILDPALLRPGRFDRQIVVDKPDVGGRQRILEVHARGKPLGPAVDLGLLARRTPGFTGADLANLLNEAAILTARRNLRQIGIRECEEAIDRVLAGPERKTLVMSDHDKLVTAYHESGHAIVGHALRHADPIHKVSIVARSRSLGLTYTLAEDRFNHSLSQLRDTMAMCLGGRSAEELVFGEPTTGAENDIERVTRIARAMVTEYGMSDELGPRQLGQRDGEVFLGRELSHRPNYSEEVAAAIDREIARLVDEAHQRARAVLIDHRATLDLMARELVDKETLEPMQLAAIFGSMDVADGRPSRPARPVRAGRVVAARRPAASVAPELPVAASSPPLARPLVPVAARSGPKRSLPATAPDRPVAGRRRAPAPAPSPPGRKGPAVAEAPASPARQAAASALHLPAAKARPRPKASEP
jgi:cell division protease FtsH